MATAANRIFIANLAEYWRHGLRATSACTRCGSSPAQLLVPHRQFPAGPDEVAGVAVRIALKVILVLALGFPEIAPRRDFGHHLSGPETGRIDVGDGVLRDSPPFIIGIGNGRSEEHPS